jgi:beta-galactosidase
VLDYARFMSDSMRDLLVGEIAAIRSIIPDATVTTNGLGFHRPTDYWSWYQHVDIAAWDSYPDPSTGLGDICNAAFCHDLNRSLRSGNPFILMEQASTQVNWRATNTLKPPGQMRALSWSAVAHGADGIMFFQWRAARAGAEKYHSAMVPHYGTKDSRVFREVSELGAELKKLSCVLGARTQARVALVVSWENRWALELESKPTQFHYDEIVQHYYRALWELNVAVDIVHPNQPVDAYDVVIAPALYQLTQQQADNFRAFVQRGGALVLSYFSGVVDDREHIWLGGYPALLKDVLGLVVEEWQPLHPGEATALRLVDSPDTSEIACTKFCELLHLRGAKPVAVYTRGWFAGRPAITHHTVGGGEACYVATQTDSVFLRQLLESLLRPRGISAPVTASAGVETMVRSNDEADFLFIINHQSSPGRVDFGRWAGPDLLTSRDCEGEAALEPFAVRVLKATRSGSTPKQNPRS